MVCGHSDFIENSIFASAVQGVAAAAQLRAIGPKGAWVLVKELFGWRRFANRRELAGSVGGTGRFGYWIWRKFSVEAEASFAVPNYTHRGLADFFAGFHGKLACAAIEMYLCGL